MSAFQSYMADAAAYQVQGLGEPAVITPYANGAAGTAIDTDVIVHRDPLNTRATDNQERLEYDVAVEVPIADYARPNLKADKITLKVRRGDAVNTTKTISCILGQAGGMWLLGLD